MDPLTQQVTVNFNAVNAGALERVTFGGLSDGNEIHIDAEVGKVVFTLKGPAVASFPSNPIQWVDADLKPIDPPSGVTVRRLGNLSTSILVDTSQVPSKTLSFYVIVQTPIGKFFGTDPTIVTMRPEGG